MEIMKVEKLDKGIVSTAYDDDNPCSKKKRKGKRNQGEKKYEYLLIVTNRYLTAGHDPVCLCHRPPVYHPPATHQSTWLSTGFSFLSFFVSTSVSVAGRSARSFPAPWAGSQNPVLTGPERPLQDPRDHTPGLPVIIISGGALHLCLGLCPLPSDTQTLSFPPSLSVPRSL
ncbi:hypothetical protein IF1G_02825 [Cordyceps javanica]|uniref:Uncharacterized protein n=1 Tax=Cordyceps javanica TaxID=43265 RepID=A0A545VAJ0_9HYPO|nr:hypothetical protein IF1G_02825 [Cordyceps javanica]